MSTMTPRRTVLTLAVTAFAALVTPPSALAAGVTGTPGGAITFTAPGDETNTIVVTRDADSVNVTDVAGAPIGTAGVCSDPDFPTTPSSVECAYAPGVTVAFGATLGPRGDSADLSALTNGTGNVSGEAGDDQLTGTSGADTLKGDDGSDTLTGRGGADQLDGGANVPSVPTPGSGMTPGPELVDTVSYADKTAGVTVTLDGVANEPDGDVITNLESITGGAGNDVLIGDGGRNVISAEAGNDTVSGGGGDDFLFGDSGGENGGDDVLSGEDGDDVRPGGVRADQLNGGAGDDVLRGLGFFGPAPDEFQRDGNDTYNGGTGVDRAEVFSGWNDPVTTLPTNEPVRVTLDGRANDGPGTQADNVGTDVEDVTTGAGNDTLTGNDAFNVLTSQAGDDTVDAGAGSDVVSAGDRDDVVSARDGYADDIDCGPGTDRATVDQLDRVRSNCEQVDRVAVAAALEDKQPTATFTGPISGAKVDAGTGIRVTADASDDNGVKEVRLLDDGKQVGVDATAPYEFTYKPTGGDVGRNTLIAVAIDEGNQSGSDVRGVRVTKFKPATKPTFLVTPKRDRRAPFTYRFAGKIALPAGVTRRQGCRGGTMLAQTKSRAGKTFSSRKVKIRTNCSWGLTLTFRSKARLGNGRLKARVVFSGNAVMGSFTTGYKALRAG